MAKATKADYWGILNVEEKRLVSSGTGGECAVWSEKDSAMSRKREWYRGDRNFIVVPVTVHPSKGK